MGFWHTSVLDKIDTGYSGHIFSNKPKEYICKICKEVFLIQDDLLQHRFQAHPFERPALFINGEEMSSTRKYFSKSMSSLSIQVTACTTVKIDKDEIKPDDLNSRLAMEKNGLKKLILTNKDLSSHYELFIQVPNNNDLKEIDRRFFEATSSGILTRSVIDGFAEASSRYTEATRYVDGIVNYLYGILAKDQKGGSCLQFSQYREKYNQSLGTLVDFDTQLALIISAVINLNFNVFEKYEQLAKIKWLYASFARFNEILYFDEHEFLQTGYSGIKPDFSVPLDSYTEKIISWVLLDDSYLVDSIHKIMLEINGSMFPPDDRFKLRVIAADYYHRNKKMEIAIELVKPAINDVLYGAWAERITKNSKI